MKRRINEHLLEKLNIQKSSPILSVEDIMIGDEGCETLAYFLQQNPSSFEKLIISGNNISPAGFKLICESLTINTSIKEIIADMNTIGENATGLEHLLKLLLKNKNIQFIDLKNNRISTTSVNMIRQILLANTELVGIDLKLNSIDNVGMGVILEGLYDNRKIKFFDISCNKVTPDVFEQVQAILSRNRGSMITESQLISPQQSQIIHQTQLSPSRIRVEQSPIYIQPIIQPLQSQMIYQHPQQIITTPIIQGTHYYSPIKIQQQQMIPSSISADISQQQLTDLKELENIIQEERNRVQKLRFQFERDFDEERQKIQMLENNIINLKEECLYKDQKIQESEKLFVDLQNENVMLMHEYSNSQKQLGMLQIRSNTTVRDLEEKINLTYTNFYDLQAHQENEIKQLKVGQTKYFQEMCREWETRYYQLDQRYIDTKVVRDQLELKLNDINEEIFKLKLNQEDNLRNLEDRIINDETRKVESQLRSLESRVQQAEIDKQAIERKNLQLQNELQDKEKQNYEEMLSMENEVTELRKKLNDQHNTLSQSSVNLESAINEDMIQQNQINKMENEISDLKIVEIRQQDLHYQQVEQYKINANNQRVHWNELLESQHLKIIELEQLIQNKQIDNEQFKKKYANLANILQANLNNTVDSVVQSFSFQNRQVLM